MSYETDRERERFRALLRHAAAEDSRRLASRTTLDGDAWQKKGLEFMRQAERDGRSQGDPESANFQ
jgi:hypothetical protein